MPRLFYLSACGLWLASCDAPAVDQPHPHEHPHPLPEIVVSADPLGAVDGHFVTPTTVLDARSLQTESVSNIGETVGRQLGVTVSDFGAGVGRPVIRGLGGARVRVLDDGIGSFDISTVSADHPVAVEPVFARQVEILRGPATLLYGSGASGGLVNVISDRINQSLPEPVDGGLYSHFDTSSAGWLHAFQINGALGNHLALHLDGLKRDTNDLTIPGFAMAAPDPDARPGTLPNSNSDADNLGAGASWIGARGHAGFSITTTASNFAIPGAHAEHHDDDDTHDGDGDDDDHDHDHDDDDAAHLRGPRIDMEQTRLDIDAGWDIEFGPVHRLTARWGLGDYEHDEIEGDGNIATRLGNREWEGRVEALLEPMGPFDGVIGVQVASKDFAAVGAEAFVPPSTQNSIAMFVFEKVEFGNLHLDAGVRFEHQRAEDHITGAKATHVLVSAAGGVLFSFGDQFAAGLTLGRAERAPALEELFAGGPHLATNTFETGDRALREETTTNIDLYIRREIGRYRFNFNWFYNHIDDFVFLDFNDRNQDGVADRVETDFASTGLISTEPTALLLVNQRQSEADFTGFELAGEMTVFDNAYGRLDWRLWSDSVDAELTRGDKVPRLPPLRFGTDLRFDHAGIFTRLRVTRSARQDTPARLETATAGYTWIDFHVSYTLQLAALGELTLFGRGENLANQTARRHTSFIKDQAPRAGRSGLIGLRFEFR